MDIQDKTLSWFGNIRDKFDNFRSDIDGIINQVPFQYAENQLFTAGANVKQFCSEFMEEVLPESLMNSLKEKTLGELLKKDANEGPTMILSEDSFPVSMEMVEDAHIDSSLGAETNVGKELCFEEIRVRETTFPFKISHVEAYYHDDEYNGQDDMPHNSSSSTPAKEGKVSDPNNVPSADLEVEVSTVHSPSSSSLAKEGEVSDPKDTEISDLNQESSALVQAISNLSFHDNQFMENQVSSLGYKVELLMVENPSSSSCAKEGEVSDPNDTEISDLEKEIDLNDRSEDSKKMEIEDNHAVKADTDIIDLFGTLMIDDKCILLDGSELCLTPNLPEETPTSQGTVCKSCLIMKFKKECACAKVTSSKDGDAESDQFGGKSLPRPLFREHELRDQDFCESDWVIL